MEFNSVATRLKFFIDSRDMTVTQFADQCGIPRPTLSQLLSGRNKKLSDVVVKLIHDRFPDLSVLWLMFGEGEMIQPAPINPSLMSEAEKFMEDGSGNLFGANLSDSNQGKSIVNIGVNQANKRIDGNVNFVNKIEEKPVPPRRVMSITIFYDDNSYETFIPEKK